MADTWLLSIGLRPGDQVRFRRATGDRWLPGKVMGREADGSVDLRDARGRSRAIPVGQIEVAERGPRGGRVWTPLVDVVARTEQLDMFGDASSRGAEIVHLEPNVAHGDLPLVLAELHRSLPVGAPVTCSFMSGPDDRTVTDDDLPGRHFWRWSDQHLVDVFIGAGFEDIRLSGDDGPRFVDATRARTLPDTVGPDMRLLVCGLNPSVRAADAGIGFVTPGNRFWPAALTVGLASVDRDPWHAIRHHGMGMTDLAKRATRRADELAPEEYRDGLTRVERLCARLQPGAVCMVGLSGWRVAADRTAVAGWQDRRLGGRPVYVMPSTSGLNAHSRPTDLAAHLGAALAGPAANR